MVCHVLQSAMVDFVMENPGTTVMGPRDGIREWRVNETVYCFTIETCQKAFCIQDVSWDFYESLLALCRSGALSVYDGRVAALNDDPYLYHDLPKNIKYVPLTLYAPKATRSQTVAALARWAQSSASLGSR